jgi:hypothetical protein
MKAVARGPFSVKLTTESVHAGAEAVVGRRAIAKTYEGDLAATAIGEMLMAGAAVAGSAGYVAIERVEGTLGGRPGSFHLQHFGLLRRGEGALTVKVIPDSGESQDRKQTKRMLGTPAVHFVAEESNNSGKN